MIAETETRPLFLDKQEAQQTVSIIVPAFNEARSIEGVVAKLKTLVGHDFEIIVVDDGSTDATGEIARKAGAKLVRHPYNKGNGAAVKSGIRAAKGDVVLLIDADGQHDVSDIERLLEYLPEYDMVVGARNAESEVAFHRKVANKVYNAFASYVTKFRIEDLTSGFRAIKRSHLQKFLYLLPNTFSYPTTITLAFLRSGYSVKYVPIRTYHREGKSKIKVWSDGIRFFLIITKIATLFSPFRIFLPVSLVLFTLGLGYYAYTFVTEHRFTNMAMLLFTTSVMVFMMGLIAEQVAQLRFDRSEDES